MTDDYETRPADSPYHRALPEQLRGEHLGIVAEALAAGGGEAFPATDDVGRAR